MNKGFNFATGYNVSALPTYVDQNRLPLLKQLVLGADTLKYFKKQLGVKGTSALNIMTLDPTVTCGSSCGFEAGAAPALVQKNIVTNLFKVNLELCPEQLINTWAEFKLQVGAVKTEMPFEEYLVDLLINRIKENIEMNIWQGDTDGGGDFDCIDGILAQATPVDFTCYCDTLYKTIAAAYATFAKSKNVAGKRVNIFIPTELFDMFTMDLVAANLYHYNPGEPDEFVYLPGTRAKVIRTLGLTGTGVIVCATEDNLYAGMDMMSDSEELKVWYSDDFDVWRVKAKWNLGVTYAFADEIGVYTLCDDLKNGVAECSGE